MPTPTDSLNCSGGGAEINDMKAPLPRARTGGAVAAILALVLRTASALLFRWYVAEARRLDIQQAPNEAIHTYPLA